VKRRRIDDEDRDEREERDERDERDESADDEDRPRKKKKKKKNKETQKNWTPYLILAGGVGGGLTLLIIIVVIVVIVMRGGKDKLTPITEYENADSMDEVFHLDVPKGWAWEASGKKNIASVKAKKGSALILANESVLGSIQGDIAGSNQRQEDMNAGDEFQPFSRVHELKKKMYEDEYSSYKEEPPVTVRTGFGKTRRSTFTCTQNFSKMKGYRATALGVQTQITVTCLCRESDWNICEAAFAHAIETLGFGNGRH
jgi:hypothetical protein